MARDFPGLRRLPLARELRSRAFRSCERTLTVFERLLRETPRDLPDALDLPDDLALEPDLDADLSLPPDFFGVDLRAPDFRPLDLELRAPDFVALLFFALDWVRSTFPLLVRPRWAKDARGIAANVRMAMRSDSAKCLSSNCRSFRYLNLVIFCFIVFYPVPGLVLIVETDPT